MGKWVKVYFTKEQYNEWKSGNGLPIGYLEHEVIIMRGMERSGIDCELKNDPLNHMTKIDPKRVEPVGWADHAVYVR